LTLSGLEKKCFGRNLESAKQEEFLEEAFSRFMKICLSTDSKNCGSN